MMFRDRVVAQAIAFAWVLAGIVPAAVAPPAMAAEAVRFTNLSVADGLSQTSVLAMLQDRRGFIWIGTQEGLNRYDGRDFVHFFREEARDDKLSHNWVWALHEDSHGRIWIGTDGGGLNRLDPDSGEFKHFRHVEDDPSTIGSDVVRAIAEDAAGQLWIGTDGGGVARVDPLSGDVVRLADLPAAAEPASRRIRVLHRDADGSIWIGTDGGGVALLDPADGSVTDVDLGATAGARRVGAIATTPAAVWIGTYEGGLLRRDAATGEVTRFVNDPDDPRSLSGDSVRSLFVDEDGALWIGTDGQGLDRFAADGSGFDRYYHNATDPFSLADDHVLEVMQDRGGVIWAGTYRGTSRWNPGIGSFTTVARRGDAPGQLSDNYVTSLAETADGTIWVGTYGGGLNRWDRQRGDFTHYRHDPDDPTTIGDDRVFALEPAGEVLWVGTRGGGLGRLNLDTGQVRRYRHDQSRHDSLSADGITTLLRDRSGAVWVGTFVAGLNRLDDPASDAFTRFRHDPADPGSLCADQVLDVVEGAGGELWVGTFGGGLCRFDPATETFTRYRHDPADPQSLSSDRAWAVHEDVAGNLWVATQDAGLNLLTAESRQSGRAEFVHYGRQEGIGNLGVYAAESDAEGNVWFSTNRGLGKLDRQAGVIRRYGVSRGLQSNEFNHGAHGRTADGELMFGGIAGFNVFRPERIRINQRPPPMAFTRVARLNRPVDFWAYGAGTPLEFSHRDVLLSFEYAALDFTAPDRNRYRHRLVGFEQDWVVDEDRRRATYTNLAAGSYRFEVTAANSDGVWADTPLTMSFVVLPAPWATWWAWAGYALLAAAAALLLYRAQARKVAVAAQIHRTNAALRAEMGRREEQERALVAANEQAQRYLDVVEVMILSLEQNGDIRLVNQRGAAVFGYPEHELIGRNFYTLVPAGARDAVQARFASIDGQVYAESPVLTRDGTERLIAWHAVALPASDDHARGLLISGTDLTQERSLERQIREAQKLEALGTLARGIAHDFNNILSAILGFSELVRTQVPQQSRATGYLDDLEVSVDRARNLVKSILTFGRQARQEAVPTLLQSLVQEAQQLLRPTLPPGIEIVTSCDRDAPAVLADPTQLHQLVMNLATNAVQAMGGDGGTLTLTVSAHLVSAEEARAYSDVKAGRHVRLVVEDTGPGMDESTRARMFEPFFTTKGPHQGTGLGLSVVHGLVTQMDGGIEVFSRPGRGTRISILLPACAEAAEAPDSVPAQSATPPGGKETLLLVDDEAALVALGRAMLAPLGYEVLSATDGREALATLEAYGRVDLVITDQNMPGMTGVELARTVARQYPGVRVVLVSGAHDAGADDDAVHGTLEKPFRRRELAHAVRRVLDADTPPRSR